MGRLRGFVPVALAVGFGVLNGYVTFAPSFMSPEADQKNKKANEKDSSLSPSLRPTRQAVSNSTTSPDTDSNIKTTPESSKL
ncbi:uncharacterized protein PADG_07001 [Paracoccidioides brasiliensis Pb18]|uniref:Uncharacterized protein n=1 Tax=Paracoccidioides brasiliensis (strain Pb18) TaxID=502780 RepID=C1GIB5_PARBD|nr:uncharacterized protein PADG_07001 [Paracoccidioides brasiliensis Pb18]EEH42181.1 hypothetical protein PADG_07001 [Paracoccidioides brasiliensis Pb18]ODH49205.1 hypothetical protein GX48_04712 [Paracoccidioides brasiliensis]